MNNKGSQTILNIIIGLLAIAVCGLLIFGDVKNNRMIWGALALFFVALAIRTRIRKNADGKTRS